MRVIFIALRVCAETNHEALLGRRFLNPAHVVDVAEDSVKPNDASRVTLVTGESFRVNRSARDVAGALTSASRLP